MTDERRQFVSALKLCAITGALMGLLYFAVIWRFRGPIRAEQSAEGLLDVVRGPAMFLVVVSLAFGWCAAWLAARVSGMGGGVLWVPVGLATLMSVAVGAGLATAAIGAVPGIVWLVFAIWGVAAVGSAFFRMKLDE